ncbi:MAG: hypothetical protein HN509_18790 [Halobacteriovoraceae bacterium]|mgnify:CR=1 FL=1|jgi:hypothetical protein|nr:hypothetical protein [Halobacteriovoraceae bacterium]MBT5095731.1 hypothetical protein [Halobacteriovoraceae bacterium]
MSYIGLSFGLILSFLSALPFANAANKPLVTDWWQSAICDTIRYQALKHPTSPRNKVVETGLQVYQGQDFENYYKLTGDITLQRNDQQEMRSLNIQGKVVRRKGHSVTVVDDRAKKGELNTFTLNTSTGRLIISSGYTNRGKRNNFRAQVGCILYN